MKLNSNQNIWFTSDTHYSHKNICLSSSTWPDLSLCRIFHTLEDMNNEIVCQVNQYVKENDILFHLGDWSFGGIDKIWEFRRRINCKNIHLVFGNHDNHLIKNKELPNVLYDFNLRRYVDGNSKEEGFVQYKSFYDYTNIVKAQDLFSSSQYYLEIEIDRQLIYLFHRPIEDFHNNERNTIHLHGHCHGKLDGKQPKNRLDVGIDSVFMRFNQYRPINWNEIKKILL